MNEEKTEQNKVVKDDISDNTDNVILEKEMLKDESN
jgi:hypothetical protein